MAQGSDARARVWTYENLQIVDSSNTLIKPFNRTTLITVLIFFRGLTVDDIFVCKSTLEVGNMGGDTRDLNSLSLPEVTCSKRFGTSVLREDPPLSNIHLFHTRS